MSDGPDSTSSPTTSSRPGSPTPSRPPSGSSPSTGSSRTTVPGSGAPTRSPSPACASFSRASTTATGRISVIPYTAAHRVPGSTRVARSRSARVTERRRRARRAAARGHPPGLDRVEQRRGVRGHEVRARGAVELAREGRDVAARRVGRHGPRGTREQRRDAEQHLVGVHDVARREREHVAQQVTAGEQRPGRVHDGLRLRRRAGREDGERLTVRVERRQRRAVDRARGEATRGARAARHPGEPRPRVHVPQRQARVVGQQQAPRPGQSAQRPARDGVEQRLGGRERRPGRVHARREEIGVDPGSTNTIVLPARTTPSASTTPAGRGRTENRARSPGARPPAASAVAVASTRRARSAYVTSSRTRAPRRPGRVQRRRATASADACPVTPRSRIRASRWRARRRARSRRLPRSHDERAVRGDEHAARDGAVGDLEAPARRGDRAQGVQHRVDLGEGERHAEAEVRPGAEPQVAHGRVDGGVRVEGARVLAARDRRDDDPVPARTRTSPTVVPARTERSMAGVGAVTRSASSTTRPRSAASCPLSAPAARSRSSQPVSAASATRRGTNDWIVSVPVSTNAPTAPSASSSESPSSRMRPGTVDGSPHGRRRAPGRTAARGRRARAAPGWA